MSIDIGRLDGAALLHARVGLARAQHGAATFEEAAQATCRYLYETLVFVRDAEAARACVLVRCFKTHPYALLEPALRAHARASLANAAAADEVPCLTLMASMGDEPSWCSRHGSHRRRCLPLDSPQALERAPMWSQFFRETGIETETLLRRRSPEIVDPTSRAVNVFCVERAAGAPMIPDQDFVDRYGVRSVFGFCGRLRRGDLYALVLFSRAPMTRADAARLRPIAVDLTSTLFRYADDKVFAPSPVTPSGATGSAGDPVPRSL